MIAASLKNAEGDPIIDFLLRKNADVNMKNNLGQVRQTQLCPRAITRFLPVDKC